MNGSFGPITVASLFLLTIVPPCDMDGASLGKMQALAPSKDEGPVEGPIAIARPPHKSARHGPARTKVVRVWTHGKGKHPWIQDWEKAHFDDKPLLRLQIGDTRYSLLLVGGRIAPLIATNTGVWRLEGLEKEFA